METTKSQMILLTVIFLMLLQSSCLQKKPNQKIDKNVLKPYPHIINMSEGFKNASQIKLSDIADSIDYIVLSKDKQELIGEISKIQFTNEYIYLRNSKSHFIMRFDITGRYLNSYGSIGRGPTEYLPGSPFTTTPNDDKLIIFKSTMDSYLTFHTNGDYLYSKNFPVSRTLFDSRSISDSTFLCTFIYVGSVMKDYILNSINCSAGIFDLNGNQVELIDHPLKNKEISESNIRNIVSMAPSITYFDNRIVLMPEGDTIYEIDSKSISKGYIADWGNIPHKKTNEELYLRGASSSNNASIWSLILETYDRTFFRVLRGNENYLFEYNKITGTTRSMKSDPYNFGFINDLDGGANIYPYYNNRAGDIWISSEDSYNFKEKHSQEFLNESIAVFPEMKEKLKTFVNNLKHDDNPVIEIVYLRKHPF